MKKLIATALVIVAGIVGSLVVATRAQASHEPIPGCKFGAVQEVSPFYPMNWSETFDFWYTERLVTSNGTCPMDAVRWYMKSWNRVSSGSCGRIWVRTFNSDGSTRTLYPSKAVCAGNNYVQTNVENRRQFRYEMRADGLMRSVPFGSFNY